MRKKKSRQVWLKRLFFLFFVSLGLGQLGEIPLSHSEINLYLSDLLLMGMAVFCLPLFLKNKKKVSSLSLRSPIIIFFLWSLITLILGLRFFKVREVGVGSLYLFRWGAYSLVYLFSFQVSRQEGKEFIFRTLTTTGLMVALFGFVQFWFWPDFSFMAPLGWDPHYYRLLSTFFDPNFCGGFFVLVLSLLVSRYLFKPKRRLIFLSILVYLALVLTYSRSTYLAFLLSMFVVGMLKEKKVFFVALIAFLFSFQFNPRVRNRVGGAVSIDESASHRLTSWEAALIVIKKHPLTGVGFNNYRYAQLKYGLVDLVKRGGHAGAGTDSSLLFLWATTGVVGMIIYLWLGVKALWQTWPKLKDNFFALAFFSSLAGLLLHGQFVNSWFFPVIIAFFWAILGVLEVND